MSSSDLYVDGYPHGTPQGYDDGCRGGACPAGIAYGLSCKMAKSKSSGDYQYRKLVDAGASIPEIAAALGLVGAETLPAPSKDTAAPKPSPAPKAARPAAPTSPAVPTPAMAKGGMSLADAASSLAKAGAATKVTMADVGVDPELEQFIPAKPSAQTKGIWAATAAILTPPTSDTSTDAPMPATPPKVGEIRAWARAKGYKVGDKGKLPQHVVDHYWDVTGRLDTPATDTELDKKESEQDTSDVEEVTDAKLPDTAATITDGEIGEVVVEISIDVPEPRPDWGVVAQAIDVEDARRWAVRFEQAYAHVEEVLERTTAELQNARNEADAIAQDYLDQFDKNIKHEAHISDLRERLATEHSLRGVAERAVSLALTKWGEERASNEAAHALILEQAHTINHLAAALAPVRWTIGADSNLPTRGDLQTVVMTPADTQAAVDGWARR